MIYIIAIVVLLCILFPQHAFKMIAIGALFMFTIKPSTNAVTSCDELTVARQMKFPLCWMMSVVGLMNNLLTIHKVDFLHPDVVAFVTEWTDMALNIDPREASCPLITPKALRDHTHAELQSNLEMLRVTMFRDTASMQARIDQGGLCLDPSELPDTSWKTWFSDHVRTRVPSWGFSRNSRLSASPQTNLFSSDVPSTTSITAKYDSPVVQDYFSGKRWYGSHPVCVSKFIGGEEGFLLESLLNYKNPDFRHIHASEQFETQPELDIQTQLSTVSNPVLMFSMFGNYSFRLLRFIEKLSKTSFLDSTGYIFLGGVLSFKPSAREDGHAIHFVACDSSVTFVDSNFDTPLDGFSDIYFKYIPVWKKEIQIGQAALLFKRADK